MRHRSSHRLLRRPALPRSLPAPCPPASHAQRKEVARRRGSPGTGASFSVDYQVPTREQLQCVTFMVTYLLADPVLETCLRICACLGAGVCGAAGVGVGGAGLPSV